MVFTRRQQQIYSNEPATEYPQTNIKYENGYQLDGFVVSDQCIDFEDVDSDCDEQEFEVESYNDSDSDQ